MELKRYQESVVNDVRTYLEALAAEIADGNTRHAAEDAWEKCRVPREYRSRRKNGLSKELPNFCIKVPTGGGKTLLATQILGSIYRTILKDRRGAGLVLWVVPSDQIYKDTLRRLRDRSDFYRESLEIALSRRIEVWEKHEIARLTPGQLASTLNILVIKLQGTNRQDKESLKFFADSGGNIMAHFPPEDEPAAHKALKEAIPNLDMLADDEDSGSYLTKTSVGNLVRKCEPAVILDEGHKATSDLARQTIEDFNASIVVELSATPNDANVLVEVTGSQLLDEEMIKLPINVQNSNQKSWKNILTSVRDWQKELADTAEKHRRKTNQYIRPIVLVQVERTGKDQRDTTYVHSEDVKEYLMDRLGIEESKIAIKTSEKDDIEGIDLLDPECSLEWIITKAALQEGWDCPFAYILVSLNNTQSRQSMTQLVGRVLRQPYQKRSEHDDLNQCYVYCLRQKAATVLDEIKKALEKEGYQGDGQAVRDASGSKPEKTERIAKIRDKYKKQYKKPFEGRIFVPRFCVKNGDAAEGLDYFKHLLAKVDVEKFAYDDASEWDFSVELEQAAEHFYQITIGKDATHREAKAEYLESDDQVKLWLVSTLGFDWLSAKQLKTIVDEVCKRLPNVKGQLALIKGLLQQKIGGFIERETDRVTEDVFKTLHRQKKLAFYLHTVEGRFEIPQEVSVRVTKKLRRANDDDVERNLFDYVPNDINEYEKSIALYLDEHPQVLWWYRNLVGRTHFSIQGYRRNLLYPDFVVQRGVVQSEFPVATVLVVEGKGKHLKGNEDTNYKRDVAAIYEEVGKECSWQELAEQFENSQFRFQVLDEGEYEDKNWRDDLNSMLTGS